MRSIMALAFVLVVTQGQAAPPVSPSDYDAAVALALAAAKRMERLEDRTAKIEADLAALKWQFDAAQVAAGKGWTMQPTPAKISESPSPVFGSSYVQVCGPNGCQIVQHPFSATVTGGYNNQSPYTCESVGLVGAGGSRGGVISLIRNRPRLFGRLRGCGG